MFSSPSAAPAARRANRQSTLRSSRPNTPGRAAAGRIDASPAIVGPSTSSVGYQRAPRLAQAAPSVSATVVSAASTIDDHDGDDSIVPKRGTQILQPGTVLRKDEFSAVTAFSMLPQEVSEALRNADPYTDAIQGSLDVAIGFGLLVTLRTCFVWSISSNQRKGPFTSCYSFETPANSSATPHALSLAVLVSRPSGRDPGLMLVAAAGSVRFWHSITTATAPQTLEIALGANETIVRLARLEVGTLVAATSRSRMLRLDIVSSGGRLHASVSEFHQQRGLFGRLFGSSATAPNGFASEGAVALVVQPRAINSGSRNILAVGERLLQTWAVLDGGGERLLAEHDLVHLIAQSLSDAEEESADPARAFGVAIVDAACQSDGDCVFLYSHASASTQPLAYGIAMVRVSSNGAVDLLENLAISHRSLRDPRPYSSPQLVIPNGGPAAFVVFADAVILAYNSPSGLFEEAVALKDSARNRFIGQGCEGAEIEAGSGSVSAICCLTSGSGSILLEFNRSAADNFTDRISEPSDRQSALDERLQQKLEQAVFFDNETFNPLSFSITDTDRLGRDLPSVVARISSQILDSTSPYLQPAIDIRSHLSNRFSRISALIEAVNGNGLLHLLPGRARTQLSADAQLLAAAIELWKSHNEALHRIHGLAEDPIGAAIADWMAKVGQGIDDDVIRSFFRSHLTSLPEVFRNLLGHLQASEKFTLAHRANLVLETNRCIIPTYQAAFRYRKETASQYRPETKPSLEMWSSQAASLQLLESLFQSTELLIRSRTRELGDIIDLEQEDGRFPSNNPQQQIQTELKEQLCELSRFTLATYEDRLSYLASESASEKEHAVLAARHKSARPALILPLVAVGRVERAFSLAESHHDFRTLTKLCLDPSTGNPASQIQHYLRRYRQAFAFELYQYYVENVENGLLKDLLEQGAEWGELLHEFLQATDNPRLEWVHNLALSRFRDASQLLYSESSQETDLKSKGVLLSLGKLCYVAEISEEELADPELQERLQLVDDQLDLVGIQEVLRSTLEGALPSQIGIGASIDRQAQAITEVLLARGRYEDGYFSHFASLVQRVLQGFVLQEEDIVDLLTLRDVRSKSDIRNFNTALEVCVRSSDLASAPSRRAACTAAIWTRAILADDWQALSQTRGASDEDIWQAQQSTTYADCVNTVAIAPTSLAPVSLTFTQLKELPPPSSDTLYARFQSREGDKGLQASSVEALLASLVADHERMKELLLNQQIGPWIEETERRIRKEEELCRNGGDPRDAVMSM